MLKNILHVPKITKNLVSVSKFNRDNDVIAEFFCDGCAIKDKSTKLVLLTGVLKDDLYTLDLSKLKGRHKMEAALVTASPTEELEDGSQNSANVVCNTSSTDSTVCNKPKNTSTLWHKRLGHPCSKVLSHVVKQLAIKDCNIKSVEFCDACHIGKSCHLPFPRSNFHAQAPLDMIYADLWGPSPSVSVDGYRYYIAFVDDNTRYTWLYPLHNKAEAKDAFATFRVHVERFFNAKVKCLQTDWGGEFRSLQPVLKQLGIMFRHPCPHTHTPKMDESRESIDMWWN